MTTWPAVVETERLVVRHPVEADRDTLVELWMMPSFMVFAGEAMTRQRANDRFDRMVTRTNEIPFAKQPIVERLSGRIVGYTGVDLLDVEGATRMEWGYRLDESVRGRGYATEAALALLEAADALEANGPDRTVFAIIDPANHPSQNVAAKLGFVYWKLSVIEGRDFGLWRRRLGTSPGS